MIEPMIPRTTTKRAIDIEPYDTIVDVKAFGSGVPETGIVRSVVVIDSGVQINYLGGTHIVRDEDYLLTVIAKPERSAT